MTIGDFIPLSDLHSRQRLYLASLTGLPTSTSTITGHLSLPFLLALFPFLPSVSFKEGDIGRYELLQGQSLMLFSHSNSQSQLSKGQNVEAGSLCFKTVVMCKITRFTKML